jgi:hypothetical protein
MNIIHKISGFATKKNEKKDFSHMFGVFKKKKGSKKGENLEFEKMLSLFSSFKVCCHFV